MTNLCRLDNPSLELLEQVRVLLAHHGPTENVQKENKGAPNTTRGKVIRSPPLQPRSSQVVACGRWQAGRQAVSHTDRSRTARQTDTKKGRESGEKEKVSRQTDRQRDSQTEKKAGRQPVMKDRQKDRRIDRQTPEEKPAQRDTHIHSDQIVRQTNTKRGKQTDKTDI